MTKEIIIPQETEKLTTAISEIQTEVGKEKQNPHMALIDARQSMILPLLNDDIKRYQKLLRSYIFEIYSKDDLKNCNAKSILDGFVKICELDLEPSASLGKLYLINYNGQINVQVGYQGWLESLWRSSKVANVYSNVVYEGDEFQVEYANNNKYKHIPAFASDEIKLTYAVVKFKSGDIQIKTAKMDEILKSKAASKGGNSSYSPWNKYFDSMAQIVPMRKIAKNLALAFANKCNDEFINEEKE
jgi:phage RecT family recombinase